MHSTFPLHAQLYKLLFIVIGLFRISKFSDSFLTVRLKKKRLLARKRFLRGVLGAATRLSSMTSAVLAKYIKAKQNRAGIATYFLTAYDSQRWVSGEQTRFVISPEFEPLMSSGIVVFEDKSKAEEIALRLISSLGGLRRHEIAVPFYRDHIYPYLVDRLGDPLPIQKVRRQIIPWAQEVLEIGVGSGANFPHYDPTRVNKLYALEPNPGMRRLAERQRHRTKLKVEFLDLPGERLPLEAAIVDTVVSTFTLCTIPGIVEALRGLDRVLRPDGKLIFFELGLSPDPAVQRWQKRLEPVHQWLFQGLYLTRDIPSLIKRGGFQIEQIETGYLAQFPKSSSHCWWGCNHNAHAAVRRAPAQRRMPRARSAARHPATIEF